MHASLRVCLGRVAGEARIGKRDQRSAPADGERQTAATAIAATPRFSSTLSDHAGPAAWENQLSGSILMG
jgi:hypothetical protein